MDAIEAAIRSVRGSVVLHRTSDPDHNRSVITYAGPGHSVVESALRAARVASERINLNEHRGVHPRWALWMSFRSFRCQILLLLTASIWRTKRAGASGTNLAFPYTSTKLPLDSLSG